VEPPCRTAMPIIVVAIPTLNEEESIGEVVQEAPKINAGLEAAIRLKTAHGGFGR